MQHSALFTKQKGTITQITHQVQTWPLHPHVTLAGTDNNTLWHTLPRHFPRGFTPLCPFKTVNTFRVGPTVPRQVTSDLAMATDNLHLGLARMGGQVMVKFIQTIWAYVLDTWNLCNTHLHPNTAQLDLPNYQQAAETLYELHHQLSQKASCPLLQTMYWYWNNWCCSWKHGSNMTIPTSISKYKLQDFKLHCLVGISDWIFRIPTNYFWIPVIQGGIMILPELLSTGISPSARTFFPNQFPIT